MSEINPALSPKEWALMQLPCSEWEDTMVHVNDDVARGLAIDGAQELLVVLGDWVPASNPHGLAAALLHGQPFGFNRDDVDRLRELAAELRKKAIQDVGSSRLSADDSHYALGVMWGEEAVQWDNLAVRIEALLPPR